MADPFLSIPSHLEPQQEPDELRLASKLWFQEDHLVVFQAGHILFRLPYSPLAKKSSVFQHFIDMPNEVSPVFEPGGLHDCGLPIIKFVDVSSEEGEIFLSAVYDSDYFEPPPAPTSLTIVLAILKLSTKYDVRFLRRRALSHLQLAYPTRLDQWDLRQEISTIPLKPDFSSFSNLTQTLMVVLLGKKYDIPWILPSALYECCQYNINGLLWHPMWTDGTIDNALKATIVTGFINQMAATPRMLAFLHLRPLGQVGCLHEAECLEVRRKAQEMSVNYCQQNPLDVWGEEDWSASMPPIEEMCELCLEACKKIHRDARSAVWDSLPGIFNLPAWDALSNSRTSAMQL